MSQDPNPQTEAAARRLMDEHRDSMRFTSFASAYAIADLASAYAAQRAFVRLQREDRAARPVGYKIGLTSARMQAMCGIDRPIAGVVLDDRVSFSGARLARAHYGRLGLEFELAVKMAGDLGGGSLTIEDVADAVEAVAPAIEIVDDRHCDYRQLDVLSLVADNSWNAGIVLGAFRSEWPDLAAVEGRVSRDSEAIDRGFGRDVLDHPLRAVGWLAEHLSASGDALRAGDIVMTGSLVTTKFPEAPCRYSFHLGGLGAVEVTVD